MHYEGNIIRPPSEAESILLQVTVGCSHNKCTFCGAYKGERFRIKPEEIVFADIMYAARYFPSHRRLFLCDGDALILPQKRLVAILTAIREQLPRVARVGAYANVKSLKLKTVEELAELSALGLGILYMGLESGDEETLSAVHKGCTPDEAVAMGKKAIAAGMKLSITVLLGIAGRNRSEIHARETGRVLSAIDPQYVGALTLMLVPGTPLHNAQEKGLFPLLPPAEMLKELREMIFHTHLSRGLFFANHASNYLPIRARMPRDRESTLALIDQALNGSVRLKPEYLRGL